MAGLVAAILPGQEALFTIQTGSAHHRISGSRSSWRRQNAVCCAWRTPAGRAGTAHRSGPSPHRRQRRPRSPIDIRRTIPFLPGAVFASLLDRSSWPAWSGHHAFELVRPGVAGPYDVGSVGLLRSGRRVMREEIVEVVADRRIGYTLLGGLPLRGYRADFDSLRPQTAPRSAGTRPSTRRPPSAGSMSRRCVTSPRGCSTGSQSDTAMALRPRVDRLVSRDS